MPCPTLLPRFGDNVQTTVDQASRMLEYAYHAYRDPAMLPFSRSKPPGSRWPWAGPWPGRPSDSIPVPSRLFPSAGHAVLRAPGEWATAAFTFGPYGGFHGHLDKLSFVLFGYGQELGVDPGRARSQAYRLPIHRRLYKATLSHNAVLVDGQSQKPATGKLESFAANDRCTVVVAQCDDAYPGVRHRRLLCLRPEYLLVFDDLDSATPRRFDWLYHNRGTQIQCPTAKTKEPEGERPAGWSTSRMSAMARPTDRSWSVLPPGR